MIADTSHDVLEKYGVWDQKSYLAVNTWECFEQLFVIDEKGVIKKIFTRPKNKAHAEEIIAGHEEMTHVVDMVSVGNLSF